MANPQLEIDPITGLPIKPVNPGMGFPKPAPTPTVQPGLMSKLSDAFGGPQGLLNFGASLMAQGGPSPVRQNFGSALGQSLLANQHFKQQQLDNMLQQMLLQTKIQKAKNGGDKPSDVQSYEYAKANGYKGSFEDWKRVAAAAPTTPAGIQEFEYFQKLPPDLQKQWMALQRQPTVPQLAVINGVPTLVDRINATQTPLTTAEAEAQGKADIARAEAEAKATGQLTGEARGSLEKKAVNAMTTLEQLDLAEPLIDVATGSTTGAAADRVAAFFGKSLPGDQANAQLKVIQAALMTSMPRMEGPQSDRDVQLYREAAGEIGDAKVPRARKRAAVNMIRSLQEKYAEMAPSAEPARIRRFNPDTGKIE